MQWKTSRENELRQFFQLRKFLDKEIQRYDEIVNDLANISKVIEPMEASEEIERRKDL